MITTTFFGPPQKQCTKNWSSFSRKKKEAKKSRVSNSITSSSTRGLFFLLRFVLLCRARLYKAVVSLSLSLSLSLAKAAAAARVFWSVDAETTTPTGAEAQFLFPLTKERERYPTISIIETQFDRSLRCESAPTDRKDSPLRERPSRAQKKKTRSDWHSLRTFFGTWTLLFVTGAVVKVVEVIIIIFSSVCVFKESSFEWRKKEDKKIQKNKIYFPSTFSLCFNFIFILFILQKVKDFLSLSFSLSLETKEEDSPHLGFSFCTYDTLNETETKASSLFSVVSCPPT